MSSFIIIFRHLFFLIYKKINPKGFISMDIYNYKMMIPMQYDGIGRALYVYRSRELDHKWILENELLPGNIVLDLGANIGYYAIMEAKKVGKSGKIYGIEPDPRNIEYLIKNINLNEIDEIFEFEQGAISNENGKAEFILSSKTNLSALGNVKNQNNVNSIVVQKYDFGEYLKNKRRIDLVRMDIEGHEIEVFDSLINFYKESQNQLPRKIIFETHFNVYKTKRKQVIETLNKIFSIGYRVKFLSSPDEPKIQLHKQGYKPFKVIKEFPFHRGIYKNIKQQDFINLVATTGGVRTVLLELNNS